MASTWSLSDLLVTESMPVSRSAWILPTYLTLISLVISSSLKDLVAIEVVTKKGHGVRDLRLGHLNQRFCNSTPASSSSVPSRIAWREGSIGVK